MNSTYQCRNFKNSLVILLLSSFVKILLLHITISVKAILKNLKGDFEMKKSKRIVSFILIMTLIMGLSMTSVNAEAKTFEIAPGLTLQYDTKDLALGNVKVGETKRVVVKAVTTENFTTDANFRLNMNLNATNKAGTDPGADLGYGFASSASGALEAGKEYPMNITVSPKKKGTYSIALSFSYNNKDDNPSYKESGAVITLKGVDDTKSKSKSKDTKKDTKNAVSPQTADPIDYSYVYTLISIMSLMMIVIAGVVAFRRRSDYNK